MIKIPVFVFIRIIIVFLFYAEASPFEKPSAYQQNSSPVVTINSPADNSTFATVVPIHYSINVSDKEDGESKYDEINLRKYCLK